MIKIATVFSGIGAPEMALKRLGWKHEIVFACDNDKYCRQSYLANYDLSDYDERMYHDVEDINRVYDLHKNREQNIDLFVGGSPCQSFSIAGKRKGFDAETGQLFFEYIRLVNELQPKVFIWENVKGVLTHDKGETWKKMLAEFKATGYDIHYQVLNAKDYGVPQNRERLFVVGFKEVRTLWQFPAKIKLEKRLKDLLEDTVDEKYFLSEKAKITALEPMRITKKYVQVNGDVALTQLAKQRNLGDLVCVGLLGGNNAQGNRVYDANGIACCQASQTGGIGATTGLYEVADDIIRRLTPKESLRLMGFPDEFYNNCKSVGISDTQLYKQAGNSMVVDVLMAIYKAIYES